MKLNVFGYVINVVTIDYIEIKGLILSIVIGLLYFYLFKKRNNKITKAMIIRAVMNYLQLLISIPLAILGILIMITCIRDEEYISLVIPICFFFICYRIVRNSLIVDFKISFHS